MEGGDHQDADNNASIRAHRAAVLTSEGQRQAAVAAATTQAAATAATVTHFRTCLASAKAQGLSALQGFYQDALRQLGVQS